VVAAHPAGHHVGGIVVRVFGDIESLPFSHGRVFVSLTAFIEFLALLASGDAHFCGPWPKAAFQRNAKLGDAPQVADLIVASGTEKQLESQRREIAALFCDLRGFRGFSESSDPEDVMALLRDYRAAIGEILIKYRGTLERYASDGVIVVFNDSVPVDNPALQAVLMALEMRDAIGALTEKWRRLGHDIGLVSVLRTGLPRSASSALKDALTMRPSGPYPTLRPGFAMKHSPVKSSLVRVCCWPSKMLSPSKQLASLR
jgi:hypothetical protein